MCILISFFSLFFSFLLASFLWECVKVLDLKQVIDGLVCILSNEFHHSLWRRAKILRIRATQGNGIERGRREEGEEAELTSGMIGFPSSPLT